MKINELKAVKNNVNVKPITEKVTDGGILIPETAQQTKDPQIVCDVLSVGPKAEEIKGASKVVCHPQAGLAMYVENTIIKVVKDDEIYAILSSQVGD